MKIKKPKPTGPIACVCGSINWDITTMFYPNDYAPSAPDHTGYTVYSRDHPDREPRGCCGPANDQQL